MIAALKRLALLFPPITRLKEQRDAAMRMVVSLQSEVDALKRKTASVTAVPSIPTSLTAGGAWSTDGITDDTYRAQFIAIPDTMAEWTAENGGFEGKDILDFGCGEAATALSLALRYKPRRVLAVDISPKYEACCRKPRNRLAWIICRIIWTSRRSRLMG